MSFELCPADGSLAGMDAFETAAVLDDPSHLTLDEPVPGPPARHCRVIVLFESGDSPPVAWPTGFFEEIRITDPMFMRPAQGEMPPVPALEA